MLSYETQVKHIHIFLAKEKETKMNSAQRHGVLILSRQLLVWRTAF